MSYRVLCTFDLKDATSNDYDKAYSALKKLGLERVISSKDGEYIIPTTTVMGMKDGSSSESVAKNMRSKIKDEFSRLGLSSEIFVIAMSGSFWASTTT